MASDKENRYGKAFYTQDELTVRERKVKERKARPHKRTFTILEDEMSEEVTKKYLKIDERVSYEKFESIWNGVPLGDDSYEEVAKAFQKYFKTFREQAIKELRYVNELPNIKRWMASRSISLRKVHGALLELHVRKDGRTNRNKSALKDSVSKRNDAIKHNPAFNSARIAAMEAENERLRKGKKK